MNAANMFAAFISASSFSWALLISLNVSLISCCVTKIPSRVKIVLIFRLRCLALQMLLTTNLIFLNYCIIFTYTFQQTNSCSLTNAAPSRQHPVENSNPSFQLPDLIFFHGHSLRLFPVVLCIFSTAFPELKVQQFDLRLQLHLHGLSPPISQFIEPNFGRHLACHAYCGFKFGCVYTLPTCHEGPEVCQKSVATYFMSSESSSF